MTAAFAAKKPTRARTSRSAAPPAVPKVNPEQLIPVPIVSPAALAPFFEALKKLEAGTPAGGPPEVVRILHFGDSHVTADYWTGTIRQLLQARFGDGGVGYVMPGRPWRYFRHSRAKTIGSGWTTIGLGKEPSEGLLGLSQTALRPVRRSGAAGVVAPGAYFEIQFAATDPQACASVLVDDNLYFSGPINAETLIPGAPLPAAPDLSPDSEGSRAPARTSLAPELGFLRNSGPLADGPHQITVQADCGKPFRLLGIDFTSGRSGIIVDTLGINGASIYALDKWRPDVRASLLRRSAPVLVIVSYGTNDMGDRDFVFADYKAVVVRILAQIRGDLPEAAVLVTGPIDRGRARRWGWGFPAENENQVIRALKEAADSTGCAFWDARAAIGGDGAIYGWAAAGLAQRDLVHLTEPGYLAFGKLLVDRLLEAYAEYKNPPSPPPAPAAPAEPAPQPPAAPGPAPVGEGR